MKPLSGLADLHGLRVLAVEAAQRIEALGYSALWQPMALRRDVMVTASLQLAATRRLVVATGIAPIYERAPLVMAAAQRALGEQSGDRFTPEEADTLGSEAQDRATAIAGQVSQAAAELGVTIEQ